MLYSMGYTDDITSDCLRSVKTQGPYIVLLIYSNGFTTPLPPQGILHNSTHCSHLFFHEKASAFIPAFGGKICEIRNSGNFIFLTPVQIFSLVLIYFVSLHLVRLVSMKARNNKSCHFAYQVNVSFYKDVSFIYCKF